MISRRTFIARTSVGGFGLYLWSQRARAIAGADPGRQSGPGRHRQIRHAAARAAGDAARRHAARRRRQPIDYYEIGVRQFSQQVLPAACRHHGLGLRADAARGRPGHLQRAVTDHRGDGGHARAHQLGQRARGRRRQLPAAPPAGRPDAALGQPSRRHHWARPAADVRPRRRGPTPGPCRSSRTCTAPCQSATRAMATPRRGTCPMRPMCPPGYAREGTWYRFFASKAARKGIRGPGARAPGTAVCQYPNSQRASTAWYHDHTLGMTRLNVYAGPAGFFIIRGGPGDEVLDSRDWHAGQPSRSGPGARRRARDDLLRDPARHPGPFLQRRRVAVLSRHARVLRRITGPVHPAHRHLADLESGVLRQHHHRQRQHLAVPGRRAAALPVPVAERVQLPLPDSRLQRHSRRRGLADRQRGRLPGRAGQHHRRPRQSDPHGSGRARRRDRRFHQRADRAATPSPTWVLTSRSAEASPARTSRSPTRAAPGS